MPRRLLMKLCSMAEMEEETIKQAFMVKRSQNKKLVGPVNFKSRWFVLTAKTLYYYDGNPEKRGKEKGKVDLKTIKYVECLHDDALGKKFTFQVGHKDYWLYIIASSEEQRREWIDSLRKLCSENKTLLDKYHAGVWLNGRWTCCGLTTKYSQGCYTAWKPSKTETPIDKLVPEQLAVTLGNIKNNTPPVNTKTGLVKPPSEPKMVVALYPFQAIEEGDISLEKGEEYEVIDDSREHWWQVKDKFGQIGFIPSNYVEEKASVGLRQFDWYAGDISRQRCEMILRNEGKEGTFVVRNSSKKGMLTLSLFTKMPAPQVKHYHIKGKPSGEYCLSEKHFFPTISDLIFYHKHNSAGLATRLKQPPSSPTRATPTTAGLSHDKWEIDSSELTLLEELGSGQFGVVRRGKWRGSFDVAVKMMKEGSMSEDDFIDEAKVMTKLQHPNLVQLYGVCSKHRPIFIVTEYMKHGSLLSYLRKTDQRLLQKPSVLLDICLQVCSGMAHLEEHNYIHRDLAARNCLVGDGNVVKVADFGLTRYVIDDEYTSSGGTKFPIKWAPPEVLGYTRFSSKSDVWAYGVLMWEVFTCGKMPYGRATNAEVVEQVQRGQRLERPRACPREGYVVMRSCWEKHPEDRPAFHVLKHQLEKILEEDV
ncbi:tyrosine-protein kinase Btk29A [Tachypleus tridentatus]|uniref:tyrosine-protein kinase Btk29A n=1 Tax=Tachypleus tridentatus TaxID=6853 RepID=UPI003FD3322C